MEQREEDYKNLNKRQQKEADELIDNFKPGNLEGKNTKRMAGEHEGKIELRGRDGLRVILDILTLGIWRIFVKEPHKNTTDYL